MFYFVVKITAMKQGLILAQKSMNRFVRDNWFKLLLVLLALYIFFQKDLSFQVNFRSPGNRDVEEQTPPQVDRAGKRERLTEKSGGKLSSLEGKRELFDLSSAFSPGRKETSCKEMLENVGEESRIAYLKRFARVALVEQKKFGIPASVILAEALLHSVCGGADWVVSGNNHFALRCGEQWTGAAGEYRGKCFRHYESAWASFRDHSLYLSNDFREELPFGQNADYKVWVNAIAKGPCSEEAGLANTLEELIETYRLFELDEMP